MRGSHDGLAPTKVTTSRDVAHELRTPVTALVSAAELLGDDPASQLVATQIGRLRRLVADLLEVSRLDSGLDPARLTSVSLAHATRTACATAASGGQPTWTLEVESDADVLLDPARFERIVANLLGNVAAHGGGVAHVVVAGPELRISDDGPGLPPEVLRDGPRRFHAVGAGKGSGLGLTIARGGAVVHDERSGRRRGRRPHPVHVRASSDSLPSPQARTTVRGRRMGSAPEHSTRKVDSGNTGGAGGPAGVGMVGGAGLGGAGHGRRRRPGSCSRPARGRARRAGRRSVGSWARPQSGGRTPHQPHRTVGGTR